MLGLPTACRRMLVIVRPSLLLQPIVQYMPLLWALYDSHPGTCKHQYGRVRGVCETEREGGGEHREGRWVNSPTL